MGFAVLQLAILPAILAAAIATRLESMGPALLSIQSRKISHQGIFAARVPATAGAMAAVFVKQGAATANEMPATAVQPTTTVPVVFVNVRMPTVRLNDAVPSTAMLVYLTKTETKFVRAWSLIILSMPITPVAQHRAMGLAAAMSSMEMLVLQTITKSV